MENFNSLALPMSVRSVTQFFEAQETLFSERLSRMQLSGINLSSSKEVKFEVNVWRNHNFESLEPLIHSFLGIRSLSMVFNCSGYDDTMGFHGHNSCDLELIWLDSRDLINKLGLDNWLDWIVGRLKALRGISTSPIILATWIGEVDGVTSLVKRIEEIAGVYFADLNKLAADGKFELLDQRVSVVAGSPISNQAQLQLARKMACHWFPGVLLPPVKAVALDLDNTLYQGVLGEDGPSGVKLTQGHIKLQATMKTLADSGVFLALISRNEEPDVRELFEKREDFPLRWDDFAATEVSWGEKAPALERVAQTLRISTESILFVDDNLGEILKVIELLPNINVVHAKEDASLTTSSIGFYPGLWRWRGSREDQIRARDLKAAAERTQLERSVASQAEYFKELQVVLTFRTQPGDQLSRLTDLSGKTNQFNLALSRHNEAQLSSKLVADNSCVVSVELSDRLTESGVIALVVAHRQGQRLIVEEVCVSCRALGRQLEDAIVLGAVRLMSIFKGCEEVGFIAKHGPRNQPALRWLSSLLNMQELPEQGLHVVSSSELLGRGLAEGVSVKVM